MSDAEDRPQHICSNCGFIIGKTMLLRKRVQFTETVWARYNMNSNRPESFSEQKPILCDGDLLLNCHMCYQTCDYSNLQSHMALKHGILHVSECDFCAILFNQGVIPAIDIR